MKEMGTKQNFQHVLACAEQDTMSDLQDCLCIYEISNLCPDILYLAYEVV